MTRLATHFGVRVCYNGPGSWSISNGLINGSFVIYYPLSLQQRDSNGRGLGEMILAKGAGSSGKRGTFLPHCKGTSRSGRDADVVHLARKPGQLLATPNGPTRVLTGSCSFIHPACPRASPCLPAHSLWPSVSSWDKQGVCVLPFPPCSV